MTLLMIIVFIFICILMKFSKAEGHSGGGHYNKGEPKSSKPNIVPKPRPRSK